MTVELKMLAWSICLGIVSVLVAINFSTRAAHSGLEPQ